MATVKRRSPLMANVDPGFSGASAYREWSSAPASGVRESLPAETFPFSERHLQAVWYDPHHRPACLQTEEGEPVTVLAPGRWNLEAGPDFLDAQLVLGSDRRTLRGDVEIHTRATDWNHHGHRDDPRYRNVVAHVTYWPGTLSPDALPSRAIQLSLKAAIAATPGLHLADIDVTAYPFAAPLPRAGDPPPPLKGLGPEGARRLLDAAGEERLRLKSAALREQLSISPPDQVLYEGVMAALGYQHNRGPFRRLARTVTREHLRSETDGDPTGAYALLMGVSSLLPATQATGWDVETARWMRGLWDHWWKRQAHWQARLLPRTAWRRSGLRPQNHPARRLAAAPALFAGTAPLEDQLAMLDPRHADRWVAAVDHLLDVDARVAYWPNRLAIGGARTADPVAILGPPRRAALVTNVIVPFVAAMGQPVDKLLHRLPREDPHHLLRHTAATLFGPDHNPNLYSRGLPQQGLLQLFHDYVLPNQIDALADACQRWRSAAT